MGLTSTDVERLCIRDSNAGVNHTILALIEIATDDDPALLASNWNPDFIRRTLIETLSKGNAFVTGTDKFVQCSR
ncbi:MAG TPA: hypothetical protein DCY02_00940 [Armatimonadetes bacterium]|nr:hypothetical protein [Armatimonadota bacterium]HCM72964.1 hypothetical protein [Armatimonadota bacterium]